MDYQAQVINLQNQVSGNKSCADCHTEDPRWSSYNLGIFLCLRCSGIHRSLGVHISKVRSLDLDTWSFQQFKALEQIGNHKANEYWEYTLENEFEPPQSNLEYWIQRKYVDKAFVNPILQPPSTTLLSAEEPKAKLDKDENGNISSKFDAKNLIVGLKTTIPKQNVDKENHPVHILKGAFLFDIGKLGSA